MSRKKSSPSNIPAVDGRHNMTSLELSEADDLATLMTVDAILGFTTHKMDKNFNPAFYDKKLRERWKEIMEEFIIELNYENTYQQLISTDKIKLHWKKDERFKRHIFRFLYLFDKRSGIEVRPCHRYVNENKRGAAIFATREWERGSQISTLFGCISEVRQSEEEFFHETKNEFSVMYSTRKNCSQLWLGPAAYVNHDCKPNCRFTEANYDSKMTLETLRDIHPNDELLIYYGNNFFGIDNIECECFTCELRGRGMYNYNNIQQNSINPLNGVCFSQSVTPRSNGDFSETANRRIVTRSSKVISNDKNDGGDSSKLSLTYSLQGALNGLKKSNDSYSFRITYSRIDRVKQKISRNSLMANSSPSNFGTPKPCNLSLKRKLKRKLTQTKLKNFKEPHTVNKTLSNLEENEKPLKLDTQIIQRRSLRQANAKNLSLKPILSVEPRVNLPMVVDENRVGKLTIKLRKTADHPNQYEHCLSTGYKPPIQKLTIHKKSKLKHSNGSRDPDSNIFSRMSELLFAQTNNSPPPPHQSDTPPFLSPWFCSEKSSSHSSKKSKTERLKSKTKQKTPKKSSNHMKIINLNRKPIMETCCDNTFDFCLNPPETSSSDIPSYSASSPTIPILEIESETELVPPQLVCELQDVVIHPPNSSCPSPADNQSPPTKHKVNNNIRRLRKPREGRNIRRSDRLFSTLKKKNKYK